MRGYGKKARRSKGAKALVMRILNILNFHLAKTRVPGRKRLYGDPRTGMDYETLFECQMELEELMGSWVDAGCRPARWPPKLRERLEDDLSRRRLQLVPNGDGGFTYDFTPPARTIVDLGLGGGYQADAKPGRTAAVALFFQFVTGPLQSEVGRCKRCQQFYWNQWGHSNKEYCGKRCACRDSATLTTQKRRSEERQKKIRAAQRAIKTFDELSEETRSRLSRTWTKWVAREAGPEVTPNFITRAINRGELRRPATIAR
jgi:hypothetical protein